MMGDGRSSFHAFLKFCLQLSGYVSVLVQLNIWEKQKCHDLRPDGKLCCSTAHSCVQHSPSEKAGLLVVMLMWAGGVEFWNFLRFRNLTQELLSCWVVLAGHLMHIWPCDIWKERGSTLCCVVGQLTLNMHGRCTKVIIGWLSVGMLSKGWTNICLTRPCNLTIRRKVRKGNKNKERVTVYKM